MRIDHATGLLDAAREPRQSFRFTWVPQPDAADVRRYIDNALRDFEAGTALPFVTLSATTGLVVGSTRFMNAEHWPSGNGHPSPNTLPDAIEIGSTWLAETHQRSGINTEAKLMMLDHAFHVLQVKRFTFKTDARNLVSRRNIERTGAQLDGVIRRHMNATDGGLRDTALYSLLPDEWVIAREKLAARLHR
jgi:RimJ/RimL family protein N-acetyltransferase